MLQWYKWHLQVWWIKLYPYSHHDILHMFFSLFIFPHVYSTVQSNSLLIDSSTIDQATVNQVFTKANELSVNYIDAPVSGGMCSALLL